MIPVALAVIATAVVLRSDTVPVQIRVEKPMGTIYWGGAGLDGGYLKPQLLAFKNAGIQNLWSEITNTGSKYLGSKVGTLVDAVRSGLLIRYEDNGDWFIASGMDDQPAKQFNLIGYSYGSLLAAQTAYSYARHGHTIDHLVLIGSPIDGDFLRKLQTHSHIKKVLVLNLMQFGDPIYAGMPMTELIEGIPTLAKQMQANKGEGHFYYAHLTADSHRRWNELARQIYMMGVR